MCLLRICRIVRHVDLKDRDHSMLSTEKLLPMHRILSRPSSSQPGHRSAAGVSVVGSSVSVPVGISVGASVDSVVCSGSSGVVLHAHTEPIRIAHSKSGTARSIRFSTCVPLT